MDIILTTGLAIGGNAVLSAWAYWKRALSLSGAIGATLVGSLFFLTGGFFFWGLLMAFFISSTGWSFYKKEQKKQLASVHEKDHRRDVWQVFANAGIGSVMAILYVFSGYDIFLVGLGISFAAVNADTWASEWGVLSKSKPRSILTGERLEPGKSGGVSLLGFWASFLGALWIAGFFVLGVGFFMEGVYNIGFLWEPTVFTDPVFYWKGVIIGSIITAFGLLGSVIDSFLGASVQALYRNPNTLEWTEKPFEKGIPNERIHGWKWLNNDGVNVGSCFLTTFLGMVFYGILFGFSTQEFPWVGLF